MRYLIFSDSHITDRFDKSKLEILKKAIDGADRVVINGDFWDGFSTTFDKLVASEWSKTLFPLLKKKQTVYIFGNHDAEKYSDERTSLFCDTKTHDYTFESGNITVHCEHGNRLVPLIDEWIATRMPPFLNNFYNRFEKAMVGRFGSNYMKFAYSKFNTQAKKKFSSEKKEGEYLAIGHTHFAEHDPTYRFMNSGIVQHGLAQYIYVEDGKITPVEVAY